MACVIYTSGSTGNPKGVLLTHRGLANYAEAARRRFELTPADRMLQFASLSFDAHAEEVFPTLAAGATLVLRDDAMVDSTDTFWQRCREWRISVADLPTAFWHELVADLGPSFDVSSALRLVILGGERVEPARLQQWRRRVRGVRVLNTYGPTESTIVATDRDVADWDGAGEVPIGRPVANVRAYILDSRLRPVPVGVPGELCLAGAGIARGYLDQAELTSRKFVDVSLGDRTERVYRTGDRARWLASGELEFLGRLDEQVKVRGFRVEPGEIEAQLATHADVGAVAVVPERNGHGTRLIAYIAPSDGRIPGAHELREHLRARLPEYMVPAAFVPVKRLPRTAGGKLDRRALPAPDGHANGDGYVAPRTRSEKELAAIWGEVLGVERVGVHDGFFDLGGHSLLAMQVAARVRERLGIELPLRELFERPTIAALAERVAPNGQTHNKAIPKAPRDEPLPLSFAQERLWFLDQLEPGSAFYNIPGAVRLRGPLNADALHRALREIVGRHESLRTTFTARDGQAVQVIRPESAFELPQIDLSELPAGRRESEWRRLAEADARRPFDLSRGPLLRGQLFHLAPDDHVLLATMHHIVSDGWSTAVLLREMTALYEAFAAGRESALSELLVQYADFAHWQRGRMRGQKLERDLDYWRERLKNLPALELPTDRPRPSMQTYRGESLRFELPCETSEALRSLSLRENVTPFMTLLAAFQASLSRYTGQTDFAVGSPVAGRERPELEGLIGFFVNALALRADLSGDPTFRELLGRVRETALGAFAHQAVPFEKLVDALKLPRDASRHPLFQVLLVLQNLPAVAVEVIEIESGTAKFDLSLYFEETGGILRGRWEFNTDLFDAATIRRLHGHWQNLLTAALAAPAQRVSELPLMSPAEERRVLVELNDTDADFAIDDCLQYAWAEQAKRTPDAVAVIGSDVRWTCRELDEHANRLAHHLRSLGVGPEVIAGVCIERSPEMVLALLATVKAGGAYVPLDPAHPAERLAFMLEDAAPRVVLTQAHLRERLPTSAATIVCIDAEWPAIARNSSHEPPCDATPENAAYVIYTSGSTGRPKGVVGTHRATMNCLHWMWRDFPFRPGEVACQKTPLSFADSIQEVFGPLLRGVPLVIIPDTSVKDPERLITTLVDHRVTRIVLVPSLLRMMLDSVPDLGPRLPDLKLWVASGEALDLDLAVRFERAAPEATLINMYGCSELSNDVTWFDVRGCEKLGCVPIGKPTSNMRVYVLDDSLRPVPVGVPGELCTAGAGVNRGYLNRPELTREKFVPDPFGPPGSRLYRTGDRVKWRPDGNLEFLGRIDQQVKLRGIRIELGEIEAALTKHPRVKQAVVVLRDEPKRLVAYVIGTELSHEGLRGFLKGRLPDYMLPAATVALDTFPLTPSGKVDRRALPAPSAVRTAASYAAPRTDAERTLAKIWADLLRVERVGRDDNFFELGGESLLAVQMIARANAAGFALSPRDLFRRQTIAELAAGCDGDGERGCVSAPSTGQVSGNETSSSTEPILGALTQPRSPGAEAPSSSLLVPMRSGDGTPLFLIHPVEGIVSGYAPLVGLLEGTIYGLEAGETPAVRIETMAASYIDAIRTVQSHGPYRLIGWSMGGLIAYEMARILREHGEAIEFLAIIDQAPSAVAPPPEEANRLDSASDEELLRWRDASPLAAALPAGLTARELRVYLRNWIALRAYSPAPTDVAMLLVRSESTPATPDASLGWAALARGGVETVAVPGDHHGMMHFPHVTALAAELRKRLATRTIHP